MRRFAAACACSGAEWKTPAEKLRHDAARRLPASDRGGDHASGGAERDHGERRQPPGDEEHEAAERDHEVRVPVNRRGEHGVVERGPRIPTTDALIPIIAA